MTKRSGRGDPQKRTCWEAAVRRWRESGQSVRAFCRAEGVRESAFYFWRRELTRRGLRTRKRSATVPPEHGAGPLFLPVQVVTPAGNGAGIASVQRGVEIILAQGRTVRVQAGFDRQTLADVLAVLEAQTC